MTRTDRQSRFKSSLCATNTITAWALLCCAFIVLHLPLSELILEYHHWWSPQVIFIRHYRAEPAFTVCGFSIPSIEELLPAHVLCCPPCAFMWSVPVCACRTDTANVYCAGVSCGFRAAGHSLSLELREDTDTTRPTWDHRTRRQSVVPWDRQSAREQIRHPS